LAVSVSRQLRLILDEQKSADKIMIRLDKLHDWYFGILAKLPAMPERYHLGDKSTPHRRQVSKTSWKVC
jgi:hypothetical protein